MIDVAALEALLQRVADRTADRVIAAMSAKPTEPARLLTRAQLAKRLGVSVATVNRLAPPSVCVGDESSLRYDLDVVREWLAAREPKATTPAAKTDVDVSGALARSGLRRIG